MPDLRFDLLTRADLESALRLSTQVGWNQIEADWIRLLDLNPTGAIAGRIGDQLVATAVIVTYGVELSWVGMVIVDHGFRGRGLGRAILLEAIKKGLGGRSKLVGLDATDLGRPVYLKHGFVDIAPIDRWSGVLQPTVAAREVRLCGPAEWDQICAYDLKVTGIDRGPLLRHLQGEAGVAAWALPVGDGGISGFVVLRPGRKLGYWHLGPLVADEQEGFAALLQAPRLQLKGEAVFADALRRPESTRGLEAAGLTIQRELMRMSCPESRTVLCGPQVWLATSFEWG